jgi:hypothetical protein
LLGTVRFILGVGMVGAIVSAVALALAVPVVLVLHDETVAWVVGKGAPPEAIWALGLLPALTSIMSLLSFFFMRHLFRLIGSVREGDPFVPINAVRLQWMGWLSLAIYLIAIPTWALAHWTQRVTHDVHFQIELPFAGLLLSMILFILARVFRQGTRMREDLEGTV